MQVNGFHNVIRLISYDLTSGSVCFPAAGLRFPHSLGAAAKATNSVVSVTRNPKRRASASASGTGLRRRPGSAACGAYTIHFTDAVSLCDSPGLNKRHRTASVSHSPVPCSVEYLQPRLQGFDGCYRCGAWAGDISMRTYLFRKLFADAANSLLEPCVKLRHSAASVFHSPAPCRPRSDTPHRTVAGYKSGTWTGDFSNFCGYSFADKSVPGRMYSTYER